MYLSSSFFISPKAPNTTGMVKVFMPHILVNSISRSLYFESFSTSFTEIFRSDGTVMSIKLRCFCSLVFHNDVRPVYFDFTISVYWYDP